MFPYLLVRTGPKLKFFSIEYIYIYQFGKNTFDIYFMKNERLYSMFVSYLSDRLNEGKISAGAMALSRISRSAFEEFKNKVEKDEHFEGKQIESFRDKKIDNIFDDID